LSGTFRLHWFHILAESGKVWLNRQRWPYRSHRGISAAHGRITTRFCDLSRVFIGWTSTHSCQCYPRDPELTPNHFYFFEDLQIPKMTSFEMKNYVRESIGRLCRSCQLTSDVDCFKSIF
jgi:hypothetical protein